MSLLFLILILTGCECETKTDPGRESRGMDRSPDPVMTRELAPPFDQNSAQVRESTKSLIIHDLVLPGDSFEGAIEEIRLGITEGGYGFSFVIQHLRPYTPPESTEPLDLGDVSFFDALEAVCEHYNAGFQLGEYAIRILPFPNEKPRK